MLTPPISHVEAVATILNSFRVLLLLRPELVLSVVVALLAVLRLGPKDGAIAKCETAEIVDTMDLRSCM